MKKKTRKEVNESRHNSRLIKITVEITAIRWEQITGSLSTAMVSSLQKKLQMIGKKERKSNDA